VPVPFTCFVVLIGGTTGVVIVVLNGRTVVVDGNATFDVKH